MDDFSKKALQCHNECREQHQVPPLKWAADLAREAQEWANKIAKANKLQHASQTDRKNAGENIAMFSGRFDTSAEQATGMWYSEVEKYSFKNPTFQSGTGHFTQGRKVSKMSWQTKVEQREYQVENGTEFEKISQRSEVVWKDSTELGMARAKTPDGKCTYVVGRYRPAGNMMSKFEDNVFKSKSKNPPSFIKTSEQSGGKEKSRVVERSWESPGQHQTRVIVKETRTNTPQGVKTVKSTTTWTTSSNVQMISTGNNDKMDQPIPKLTSLHISDKEKPVTNQKESEPKNEPSGSFKEMSLSMHNRYRRKHQVSDLRWNNELARDAQAWAEKIARQNTLQHSTSQQRKGDGENLAFFGGRSGDLATEAVNMWYNEEKKYQYGNPGFKSGTGHFTQVVWKDSKEVGMGIAKSPDGRSTFIVGRYRPAGNMMGAFEQNVFPPK